MTIPLATPAPAPLPGNGMNFVPTDNSHMDRSFVTTDLDQLIRELTVQEKIALLAGKDRWSTNEIERLNIPSVKVTDGPNGARGGCFYKMIPVLGIPCGSALGSTFSPTLLHELGGLLADETKARKCVSLLGPTINVPRNPLCGRVFEQFSEDPTLSGHLAAAYINGLQEGGISPTIKHFVGNEQEHERNGVDSVIPARALREVYLRPFQIAQNLSKPWAYMTSYNKVNGVHASEDPWLLQKVLREEWGFGEDGFVMSDWWGTYSIDLAIKNGLSLEMPGGVGKFRQEALVMHQLKSHKLLHSDIDRAVRAVLKWTQKVVAANEDMVYSTDLDEFTRPLIQEDATLLRRAAVESIVLLKNEGHVLPITPASSTSKPRKVAIIGPNANAKVACGGGSAQLRTSYCSSPWEALSASRPSGVELEYSLGCRAAKFLPILDECFTSLSGQKGFDLWHYPITVRGEQGAKPVLQEHHDLSDMWMYDFYHPQLGAHYFTELHTVFTSPIDGEYELGLVVSGKGWLWVEDELVIENWDVQKQVQGTAFRGFGTTEVTGRFKVKKDQQYRIKVVHDTRLPAGSTRGRGPIIRPGLRVGAQPARAADDTMSEAVELARQSDSAILVVGLNMDWESEGFDRADLSLPLDTNTLIERVAAVNPNTVVVIQAGSAVSMPWLDSVKGVVYAWYLGNECGSAIADVLYGTANPSGRLSLTLPKREEDLASYADFKSARTKVHYSEGIWVGYKWHNMRKIQPLFPFGHGLSYTTFDYTDLKVEISTEVYSPEAWTAQVYVTVRNTGDTKGDHSVHLYLTPPEETEQSLKHPSHSLQGFAKVYSLEPGQENRVKITLDKYAISHWDELTSCWMVEKGVWKVSIGVDAQTFSLSEAFVIEKELSWSGI